MHSDFDMFAVGVEYGAYPSYVVPNYSANDHWEPLSLSPMDPLTEALSTPIPVQPEAIAIRMGIDMQERMLKSLQEESCNVYAFEPRHAGVPGYDPRLPGYDRRYAELDAEMEEAEEAEDPRLQADVVDDDEEAEFDDADWAWHRAAEMSRVLSVQLGYKGVQGENGWLHPTPAELSTLPPASQGQYHIAYATFLTRHSI